MKRFTGPAFLALALSACGGGSSASPLPAATLSPGTPAPVTGAFWQRSQSWAGGAVAVSDLQDGLSAQPTGPALVAQMQQHGVNIVRLLPDLTDGPSLKTAFDNLQAGGIAVIFQVSIGSSTVTSAPDAIAADEAELQTLSSDYDGKYPANLVALDAINEPLVDGATLPILAQITTALRSYSGLPVTIGGWQVPGTNGGANVYNQPSAAAEVAPLVDYLSIHMYPEGIVGDYESTDPTTYETAALQRLQQMIAAVPNKPIFVEEFGAINGVGASKFGTGSAAHQKAVIDGSLAAMQSERAPTSGASGIVGGTVWILEGQGAGLNSCNAYAFVCFSPAYQSPAWGDWTTYGF